jgi:DNA polymerase-3 subunit delta
MIIFLYGEESFLSAQKLKDLKNKFLQKVDPSGANYLVVDGAKTNLRQIHDHLSSGVLLAKKRMVVIKNLSDNQSSSLFKKLPQTLKPYQDINDPNVIVIIENKSERDLLAKFKKPLFELLKTQPYTQHNKRLTSPQLNAWIQNYLRQRNTTINFQALELLKIFLGNDLWQISAELNKLIHYKTSQLKKEKQTSKNIIVIQKEDVENLIAASAEVSIFALTDAIGTKNQTQAFRLLEKHLVSGVNEQYLLTMIIRQFRILLQIKESIEDGLTSQQIISQLKLHPFVAQKGVMQSRRFTVEKLKQIITELIKIDYQLKQGLTNFSSALNLLFLKTL